MKTNKLLCLILTFMMLFTFTPAFAATDAEAVDAVLAKAAAGTLVDGMTEITSTLTLPTEEDGVTLSWSLEENDLATLTGNTITVKAVSLTEDITLPLTVTAASGTVIKPDCPALAKVTLGNPVPQAPADSECVYVEKFDYADGTTNANWNIECNTASPSSNNKLEIKNGQLQYTRKEDNRNTVNWNEGIHVKLDKSYSASNANGIVFEVEFTWPKDSGVVIHPTFWSTGSVGNNRTKRVIYNKLTSAAYTNLNYSSNDSGTINVADKKSTHIFKYVIDFTNTKYDLYVDDNLAATDLVFATGSSVNSFALVTTDASPKDATNGDVWSINYIKAYYPVDARQFVVDTPVKATYENSITLDTNDGDITWESSDTTIIPSIDPTTGVATINRPEYDTDVTLKASKTVDGIKYFKTFTVKVYGNMVPPQDGENIFFEDFTGNKINSVGADAYIGKNNTGTAAVSYSDDRLVITAGVTSANAQDVAYFKFANSASAIKPEGAERIAYEFDVETVGAYKMGVKLSDGSGAVIDARPTLGGTGFTAHDTYGSGNGHTTVATGISPLPMKSTFAFVVDYGNDVYNLYVNGIEVARGFGFGGAETVNSIQFAFTGATGSTNTIYVDNIKVFVPGLNAYDKVDADYASITRVTDINNNVVDDLVEGNFEATASANSSKIKYSSAKGYVKADGTLNRPALTDTDTVTATVYCGTYEKSKTFEVTIAGNLVVKELDETASGAQDGKYTAVFPAYTLDGEPKTVTMFVAHYTPDGSRMLAIKYVAAKTINPKGAGGENGDNIVEELLLDSSDISATPNVKAFIWSDEQSISPLPLVK